MSLVHPVSRHKVPGPVRTRGGFTLVEIMVVIGIVGIMATITAPPIYRYMESSRLQTNTDRMAADLQYARSLSIANGQILRLSARVDGYQLTNPNTGVVIREATFGHDLAMPLAQTADFYPWGMADARVFNITNHSGARQITLLPTGIVEVD